MINLYIQNGIAYVWNAEDWYTLRSKHRICGSLIGSVPSFPRQNDFLGLPLALLAEETALLLEKGICELYEVADISKIPSQEDKQKMELYEQKILNDQRQVLRQKRIDQISQKIDVILAGKRQKLLSQGVTDVELDKETLLQEEINKLPTLAPSQLLVHLPTEHFIDLEKKKVPIEVLTSVANREWPIRYAIFKDLWEKGNYITSGSKFGSDYLLYPGDPVRFHAMYMVRCVCDQTTGFSPANFVAFGRLSVSVNKLALLAFCNNYGQIEYQTLQWHEAVNG